jgi:hypothetical protein
MKITPLQTLTALTTVAWGAAAVEAYVARLPVRQFAVLLGAAVTSSIVRGMHRHAERMHDVTREHAEAMVQHAFAMEKVFKLGQQAETQIRTDVTDTRALRLKEWKGTGPFPVYKDA